MAFTRQNYWLKTNALVGAPKMSSIVERNALGEVPRAERKPWPNIAMIWAGAMICVPALMIGGVMISGLPVWQAIIAGTLGYATVVTYMAFQGMVGADLGRPTVAVASSAFGDKGSRLIISFVLGVAIMGWFGVQTSIAGSAFSEIMKHWLGVEIAVPLSTALWGVVMLTTAILGYRALAYLNYIAVPALLVLAIYGTYIAVYEYGLTALVDLQPNKPISLLTGIGIAVGTFAVGGVIAGDYTRYAVDRKGAILSCVFGVLPLGILLLIAGALMSAVAGSSDMTKVISNLGYPGIGLTTLILATWTTNAVNAYSAGLALTKLFRLNDRRRALATGVAGIIGTVLAIAGIIDHFIPFLLILTMGICPIAGVMIADYWIVGKGKRENWTAVEGLNYAGVVSWAIGFAVAYFLTIGIAPVNAIVSSMIAFCILKIWLKRRLQRRPPTNI